MHAHLIVVRPLPHVQDHADPVLPQRCNSPEVLSDFCSSMDVQELFNCGVVPACRQRAVLTRDHGARRPGVMHNKPLRLCERVALSGASQMASTALNCQAAPRSTRSGVYKSDDISLDQHETCTTMTGSCPELHTGLRSRRRRRTLTTLTTQSMASSTTTRVARKRWPTSRARSHGSGRRRGVLYGTGRLGVKTLNGFGHERRRTKASTTTNTTWVTPLSDWTA